MELVNSEMRLNMRRRALEHAKASHNPVIIISSYQLVTNMIDDFRDVPFDYVVLDEGQ